MAFKKSNLFIDRGSFNDSVAEDTTALHTYKSSDSFSDIESAGYFPAGFDARDEDIQENDILIVSSGVFAKTYRIITKDPVLIVEGSISTNPFDQDLNTTDTVTFDELTVSSQVTLPDAFQGPTFQWQGAFSTPINAGNAIFYRAGDLMTVWVPAASGTADTASNINSTILSVSQRRPRYADAKKYITVTDNGTTKQGMVTYTTAGEFKITVGPDESNFAGSGTTGFESFYLTFIANPIT